MANRMTQQSVYDYYEKLMDRIYLSHHTYPTNIPPYSFTAEELAHMSEADAMGRELGKVRGDGQSAGYKCTVFHRSKNCNGLPRRGR